MSRFSRGVLSALLALLALAASRLASACAACGCGDPTLSAVGAEKPYAGRLRLSLNTRYRSDTVGTEGVNKLSLQETRADLQAAWSPTARWTLLITIHA